MINEGDVCQKTCTDGQGRMLVLCFCVLSYRRDRFRYLRRLLSVFDEFWLNLWGLLIKAMGDCIQLLTPAISAVPHAGKKRRKYKKITEKEVMMELQRPDMITVETIDSKPPRLFVLCVTLRCVKPVYLLRQIINGLISDHKLTTCARRTDFSADAWMIDRWMDDGWMDDE